MIGRLNFAQVLFCCLMLSGLIPVSVGRSEDLSAKFDEYLARCVELERFSGTILVSREGRTVLSKGYGWANAEHKVPNTSQTKFRLGSITKQFTASAILLLQERGKLDVHDPISKHLPDAPPEWAGVTTHHLLTHTSGVPNFTSFPDYQKTWMVPSTPAQLIARFRDKPLEFEPGVRFNYSNSGYILLGAIIEKTSGTTYEAFVRENICEPLQLRDTGYDHSTTVLAHRAAGYERLSEVTTNAEYIDMSIPYAAGALYSTVEDLARWDQALTAGKLLSPQSFAAMYTPVKGDYAYGWTVKQRAQHKEISHGGGINGFNTFILRYPEEHVCVVVLSNVVPASPERMAHDLAAIVSGEPYSLPTKREAVKVDPALYDTYAGRYQLQPDSILTIQRSGDRLLVQGPDKRMVEIFPESETEFFFKVVDAQITFVKNEQGQITHLMLRQAGHNVQAKRLE
jgi:CubicO group peptidase (beta-lactamase class C family)